MAEFEFGIEKWAPKIIIKKVTWKKIKKMKKALTIFSIILIVGFLVFANRVKLSTTDYVTYIESEPYTTTEEYEDLEPYTVEECEDVQVPYSDQECTYREYSYTPTEGGVRKELKGLDWICYGEVDIKNNENQAGQFTIGYSFFGKDGEYRAASQTKNVYSQGTETFTFSYDCGWLETVTGQGHIENVPKVEECETVTKYRTETQCGEITKYKKVNKTRTVTKYRDMEKQQEETVYQTLFEQWFGRNII